MAEDKALNLILSKIEDLDSKFDKLDSKFNNVDSKVDKLDSRVDKLDSKFASLDSRVDGLEVNLSSFRGEFNSFRQETSETLSRIEKRVNATFEQVGGLSEFRTKTESQLDNIQSNMEFYAVKQIENEKEIYKLNKKIAE